MVCVVDGEAAVVVVAVGVVTAGAGHGFLCLSSCQLNEAPPQTTLTPLLATRARFWFTQAWGKKRLKKYNE